MKIWKKWKLLPK